MPSAMDFVARDLCRRIDGRPLFAAVSFRLRSGERLVVQGPSGSGKSQLLRCLAWLVEPDEGSISLDGRLPPAWGVPRWRARVRYVPQRPDLPGSAAAFAEETLHYRSRPTGGSTAADPAVIAAGLGIDDPTWRRPWHELSGGEQQRAALALAVASDPAVLLLDEPTSALDADATAAVEALLAGRTLVWVTHDDAQAARLGGQRITL